MYEYEYNHAGAYLEFHKGDFQCLARPLRLSQSSHSMSHLVCPMTWLIFLAKVEPRPNAPLNLPLNW